MAREIYEYCKNYSFIDQVYESGTLRRAVKLAAMEYALDNGKPLSECLNSATINEVINIFGR